jgi:hypothetical protein
MLTVATPTMADDKGGARAPKAPPPLPTPLGGALLLSLQMIEYSVCVCKYHNIIIRARNFRQFRHLVSLAKYLSIFFVPCY